MTGTIDDRSSDRNGLGSRTILSISSSARRKAAIAAALSVFAAPSATKIQACALPRDPSTESAKARARQIDEGDLSTDVFDRLEARRGEFDRSRESLRAVGIGHREPRRELGGSPISTQSFGNRLKNGERLRGIAAQPAPRRNWNAPRFVLLGTDSSSLINSSNSVFDFPRSLKSSSARPLATDTASSTWDPRSARSLPTVQSSRASAPAPISADDRLYIKDNHFEYRRL